MSVVIQSVNMHLVLMATGAIEKIIAVVVMYSIEGTMLEIIGIG